MISIAFYNSDRPDLLAIVDFHVDIMKVWIPQMCQFLPSSVPLELPDEGMIIDVYPLTPSLRLELSQFFTEKLLENRYGDAAMHFPVQAVSQVVDCLVNFSFTHIEIELLN